MGSKALNTLFQSLNTIVVDELVADEENQIYTLRVPSAFKNL